MEVWSGAGVEDQALKQCGSQIGMRILLLFYELFVEGRGAGLSHEIGAKHLSESFIFHIDGLHIIFRIGANCHHPDFGLWGSRIGYRKYGH